jgi:hypothetical protein
MAGPPFNVVVVPGIMGTQLSYRGGFGGKTVLWANTNALIAQTPLAMALANDGSSPYPVVGKTLFPDGPVGLGVYEPLLTGLVNAGLTPTFWGYDWRLSLLTTAAQFAAQLPTLGMTSPFSVVAHSMGGLVAQLAYPMYKAAGGSATWAGTYYLGTPHGGSHWAPMCLNGVFSDFNFLNYLATAFDLAGVITGAAPLVYEAANLAIGTTIGSWPALYQLLPSSLGPWANLDVLAALTLQPIFYEKGPGGVQSQWLTLAANVLAQLNANLSTPRPFERSYIGTGFNTPASLVMGGNFQTTLGYNFSYQGDGAVLMSRGTLPSSDYEQFAGATHNGMLGSYGVVKSLSTDILSPPQSDTSVSDYPSLKFAVAPLPPPIPQPKSTTYPSGNLTNANDP